MILSEYELEVENCVYKLYCGHKYIIVKAKNLAGSIFLIDKGFASFIAGGKLAGKGKGLKEWNATNGFYFPYYRFIKKNPGLQHRIEIILESNDAFELLKFEQQALHSAHRDRKCLNSNVSAYIPVYRKSTDSHGWISKEDVARFNQYLQQPSPIDVNSE